MEHAYAELDAEQRRDIEYNRAIEQHIQDLADRRAPLIEWLEQLRIWCKPGQEPPRTVNDLDRALRISGDLITSNAKLLAFDKQISDLRAQLRSAVGPGATRELIVHINKPAKPPKGDRPEARPRVDDYE